MGESAYILNLLQENRHNVVFIPKVDPVVIAKYACAMANTHGGAILVGLKENGEVVGLEEEISMKVIQNALSEKVSPSLPFLLSITEKEEKEVAIISVWEGSNKPYVTDGTFYIQKDEMIIKATPEDVIRLFEEKQSVDESWERLTQETVSMDDIDVDTLSKVKSALAQRDYHYGRSSRESILKAMGFVKSGTLTNAGVVVMVKHPSIYIPQTRIRVSVFAEEQGHPTLVDVRLYDVSLVKAVDELSDYLYGLYPKRVVIDGMIRKDVETLPLLAIREGLLNAVVHRTYESHQSFAAINAYADHLEIVNSGQLMEGVTLEGLKGTHRSVLRNPDIANAFYQLKYIEMVGSGTLRIMEECRRNQCEAPVWSLENGCVVLTFPNVYHHLQKLSAREPLDVSKLTTDASVRESLTVILDYLVEHDHVKLQELTEVTGKSYPTVKRYMQILKDAAIIQYNGSLRSGGWSLSKSNPHLNTDDNPNDDPNDDPNKDNNE